MARAAQAFEQIEIALQIALGRGVLPEIAVHDVGADDFAARFAAFLASKREDAADVEETVRAIISDVAARGDEALAAYTRKFDRIDVGSAGLRVTPRQRGLLAEQTARTEQDWGRAVGRSGKVRVLRVTALN